MAFLELNNVRKSFGAVNAVESFNLKVERGELVSFLGPSGCGKTTTLRMIAGFEMPTVGTITISGADVTYIQPNKRNVGMVFQSYALFPNMNVTDNIGFGLKIAGKASSDIKKRAEEMLTLIHMPGLGDRYPYQLSGGQQQRVALARALAFQPQVLLLDEPLSALDAKIRVSLRQEIRSIQRKLGITTVYVTHDQEEALSMSDRVVVMNNGRTEQIGTPFEIYNFPTTEFVAQFVGTLNTLTAEMRDVADKRLVVDGQEIQVRAPARRRASSGKRYPSPSDRNASAFTGRSKKPTRWIARSKTSPFSARSCEFRCGPATNVFYMDTFNNPFLELPKIGDKIKITFSAEAVLVLRNSPV